MQFTHTHINILQGTLHTRAPRTFATAMERNLDPIPGGLFIITQLKVTARNAIRESSSRTVCPDFAAARQSPVGEIAPVFVCQRVAFYWKSFPPVLGIKCEPLLAGIFTGKHQQFKSTLSKIGR